MICSLKCLIICYFAADRVLEQELIPVQRAINNLAQSGAQLEAGDVKAAAGTLRCEESPLAIRANAAGMDLAQQ